MGACPIENNEGLRVLAIENKSRVVRMCVAVKTETPTIHCLYDIRQISSQNNMLRLPAHKPRLNRRFLAVEVESRVEE